MNNVEQYDQWLLEGSDAAALVMRQWLEPIEGKDAVIFPPTYAKPEGVKDESWLGYNIDRFDDGSNVCQIDSVGSQANRMEPIFKREQYQHLVPQVLIRAEDRTIDLLDAGHRAADAVVRFSTLGPEIDAAYRALREESNAEPLAQIAPTSIVFGSWDSRATQVKLPRIIRSVIRAYNVRELHRSAQYSTIAGEILEGGEAEVKTEGVKAQLGLAHVPAVRTHGGVQVLGEIRRDGVLNLVALRALAGSSIESTHRLRRYVLGLALVSFTAPAETFLREGCQLVPDPAHPMMWSLVRHDGTREGIGITHDQALAFATAAVEEFGVGEARSGYFEPELARRVENLKEEERKRLLRQGPITREAIEQIGRKGAKTA